QGGDLGEDQVRDGAQVALALQHPGVLGDVGLEPVLLHVFLGRLFEVADHLVDLAAQQGHLPAGLDPDRSGEIALGDRRGYFGDRPHLAGQVGGQLVDVVGQVLPGAGGARGARLATQLAFGTDLTGHAGDFRGEGIQLIDHDVNRVLELEHFALDLDRDLLGQVALLHRRGDLGDVADLGGQVGGQLIDVVGEVLPGAGGARHVGLAAQAAVATHLTRHSLHVALPIFQLIDHDVDRVLQLEDFALDVDRDLLRQVTTGDGGGDVGDVAHLGGQVACHRVHVVGEVFPGS